MGGDQLVEPGPQGQAAFDQGLEQQQGRERGVAFGGVHSEAHATRFFAAHQALAGQHFAGDVLEAHGLLEHGAAQAFGHLLHQVRAADGLDHHPRQLPRPCQMVDEQRHEQLGATETAALVNSSDAVAIAIKDDAHRRLARGARGLHRRDQLTQVGRQGLGGVAAKQGVAFAADLMNHPGGSGLGSQQRRQHPGGRAVHGVDDHPQADALQTADQGRGVDLGPQSA